MPPLQEIVWALFAVLAVIGGGAWLLRRVPGVSGGGTGRLRCLAALPLGTRERLVLVEADGRCVLLGVVPGNVSLLADLGQSAGQSEPGELLTLADGIKS